MKTNREIEIELGFAMNSTDIGLSPSSVTAQCAKFFKRGALWADRISQAALDAKDEQIKELVEAAWVVSKQAEQPFAIKNADFWNAISALRQALRNLPDELKEKKDG